MQSGSLSGDGLRAAFAEADGSFVYDPASGRRTSLRPYAGEPTRHVLDSLSVDGSELAVVGDDGAVRLVDLRTGATRILGKHSDSVMALTFSWSGRVLASAGRDGVLKLWDVASGAALKSLTGHSSFIFDAMFSRDDMRVVTAGTAGTARVWDLASGRSMALAGQQTAVQSADFSPDGTAVLTASSDGAVTRWDLATGQPLVLRRETSDLNFVRSSIDGKLVLTGGTRRVSIWDPGVPRIPDDPAAFGAWLAQVTTAEVDASGRLASR